MNRKYLTKTLTYLGSIPFIFFTCLKLFEIRYFLGIATSLFLITYTAIISSFISGIHFAYAISQNKMTSRLLISSNIISLFSWVALLLNLKPALVIVLLCYLCNVIIDFFAYQSRIIEKWFFDLRLIISFVVIICLVLNF